MTTNAEITTKRAVDIADPVFQNVFSAFLEKNGDPLEAGAGIMMQLSGNVGDLNSPSFHGETAFRYAINEVSFPKRAGVQTIHKHNPNPPKVVAGDRPQNADNTVSQRYVSMSFSPVMYQTQKGFGVDNAFLRGVMPFDTMMPIFQDMQEQVRNFESEKCLAVMAGRLGASESVGWVIFNDGDETYNSDQAVQIASHKQWDEIKTGTADKLEPTEILSPATADGNFIKNPRPDRTAFASGHQLDVNFFKRLQSYLASGRMNYQTRGMSFKQPRMFSVQDTGRLTGTYTRVPDNAAKYSVWLNTFQLSDLRDDDKWEQFQNSLAEGGMGVKVGIATGQVGDFYGVRLFEMPKALVYPGPNNTQIARGFVLGQGAMLKVAPRFDEVSVMYHNTNRRWNRRFPHTGNLYEFVVAPQAVGWTSGLFWRTYLAYAQMFWPLARPGSALAKANGGKISNVMAVDSVLSASNLAY